MDNHTGSVQAGPQAGHVTNTTTDVPGLAQHSDHGSICGVCWQAGDEGLGSTACGHSFHPSCLDLSRNAYARHPSRQPMDVFRCPTCRVPLGPTHDVAALTDSGGQILLPPGTQRDNVQQHQDASTGWRPHRNENGDVCPICIGHLGPADDILTTECNHTFHNRCLADWADANQSPDRRRRSQMDPALAMPVACPFMSCNGTSEWAGCC